jgi:hypothetical protein
MWVRLRGGVLAALATISVVGVPGVRTGTPAAAAAPPRRAEPADCSPTTALRVAKRFFLRGEGRCNPSGGSHSRLWRWDGSRRVAGPWTQVSAAPRTVHLDNFLSQDRKVWCRIFKDSTQDEAWCVTMSPQHSGSVRRNGTVRLCKGPGPGTCTQNWDTGAPVLRHGQLSELYGYRCSSATKGITCTVITGAGKGKGFLINRATVRRVGPP